MYLVRNAIRLFVCFIERKSKIVIFVINVKKTMKMCDYYIDKTSMCGVLIELCPFHNHYRNWIPRHEMCRYANENLTKKPDVIKWQNGLD